MKDLKDRDMRGEIEVDEGILKIATGTTGAKEETEETIVVNVISEETNGIMMMISGIRKARKKIKEN